MDGDGWDAKRERIEEAQAKARRYAYRRAADYIREHGRYLFEFHGKDEEISREAGQVDVVDIDRTIEAFAQAILRLED